MTKLLSVALTVATALPTAAFAQLPAVIVSTPQYQPLTNGISVGYTDGDDEGKLIPLGFTFPYFGQPYTHVMVNSNGLIVLGNAATVTCASSCLANTEFPSMQAPNFTAGPMIAGFWDDLDASVGSVRYVTSASSFTVEFAGVQRYTSTAALVTFQIRLESSGVFSIHHGTISGMPTQWTASVGFQNATGTLGLSLLTGCTTACGPAQFVPNQLFQMGAPTTPDLTVPSVSISGLMAQSDGNLTFTVDSTLSNRGRTDATNFIWRAALSRDRVFDLAATDGGADLLVATGATLSLPGFDGGASLIQVSAAASTPSPPPTGEYYVLVEVDPTQLVPEADETNNVGSTITPITQGDDVLAVSIFGPAAVAPGTQESVSLSMTNRSVRPVTSLAFQVLFSTDTFASSNDVVLATGTRALSAGQTLTEMLPITIPSTVAGGGFFLLQLDPAGALAEANELNNVVASPNAVTVTRGDLEASQTTVLDTTSGLPTTVGRFGQTLRATVRIRNTGTTTLSSFRVGLLLSRDASFSLLTDTYLCDQPVVSLAPAATQDVAFTCTLPLVDASNAPFSRGEYYILGLVDALGAISESNELNNGAMAGPLTLSAPGPDLAVTGVTTSPAAGAGESFLFQRTIRNVGDAAAGPATYRYFASRDATVTASDTPLTMDGGALSERTLTLAAGARDVATDSVDVPGTLTPGAWFIGCIVDFGGAVIEGDESNNVAVVPVTVVGSGLIIATTQLPDAVVNRPYAYQLVAEGTATPRWLLESGDALPPGLSLSATGLLSGTPTVQGVTSFGVRVNDLQRVTSGRFTLRVAAAVGSVEITTTVAPPVVADPSIRYELRLAAIGGAAPYTWRVASGTLPSGLSCSSDGVVSGSAPAATLDVITRAVFEASDTLGVLARRELVFRVVAPGALVITSTEPPVGFVGRAFTHGLTAGNTDGSPVSALTWSLSSGALPEGLTLVSNGSGAELTGTPRRSGLSRFAITAEDAEGRRDTAWLDVHVQAGTLQITSPDLPPPLRPGEPVEFHFVATGAVDPQFSLVSGELPPGLTLAANGTVSGLVPDERGRSWAFVVEVRDATGARGVGAFSVSVQPLASGCSSTASLTPWAVLLVALLSLRRRRGVALLATALVLSIPFAARAQYSVVGPTPASYQPLTAGMTVMPNTPINLPFPVRLFDLDVTTVALSQYGYLVPAGQYTQTSANLGIPHNSTSSFVPQAFIAPWWDALTLSMSYRMQVTGTAPRRVVTFEWNGAGANLTTSRVSFQVELAETTHRIRFLYSTALPGTVSASVGLQKAAGVGVAGLSCAATGFCTNATWPAAQAIEFLPPTDLLAGALSGPDTAWAGVELPAAVQVSNRGGRDLAMVAVRFLLSADAVLDGSDAVLGTETVAISAGEVATVRSTGVVPQNTPQGARFVFAQVDPGSAITEVDETNNTSGPFPLIIAPPISDLVASSMTAPATATAGGMVALSAEVRNAGTLTSAPVSVSWWLSTNPAITSLDVQLGSPLAVSQIAPGLSLPLQTMAALPGLLPPGRYWLGVCVSQTDPEASLVNNCLASSTPTVVTVTPLRVATTMLPQPTLNVPYGVRLRHEGGDGLVSWSVVSGALPAGLGLAANGELEGTPLVEGVFPFEVEVASGGLMARAPFELVVETGRALSIVAQPLSSALLGRVYEVDLFASGGRPPYAWTVASGAWPSGLMLSPQGLLTGRPLAAGDFMVTVTVTDAAGASQSHDFTLSVTGSSSLEWLASELPEARLDEAYSAPLALMGGRAPYGLTWVGLQELPRGPTDALGPQLTPAPGELGLQVDSTGLVGTPNRVGSFALTFLATDADGKTARVRRVLTVTASSLDITTTTLPDAVFGEPYQARIETNGLAELSLACTRAAPDSACLAPPLTAQLPAGVLLASSGDLSGAPTATGATEPVRHTFLVKAVDPRGRQGFRALSITVSPPKRSGCSSVPGGLLCAFAVVALLRRRARS